MRTVRQRLKWAMSEPERLRPGQTRQALTESVAQTFASLAQSLRDRDHDSHEVARFLNRLVFCMFAEDVGLLPRNLFTRMLEAARRTPSEFVPMARELFGSMASGGRFGVETVAHFNGGLFTDDDALPLSKTEIETVLIAARLNWPDVDPSILGTLFERGLDPAKRSQLGAHYTDREKVMLIVEPVVVRPLEAEWKEVKEKIAAKLDQEKRQKTIPAARRRRREAERLLREFLEQLRRFTVLDPGCGSGNFLFLALKALKDLEHRVQLEAEALDRGLQRSLPRVGPANVKGIEINPYAAELARVSVWIGEIQWMRSNGFSGTREPILDPLETIECRDALFESDTEEADWPEADVVIGNPPFVGGKKLRRELGDEYVDRMFSVYEGRVPQEADLVGYWFHKAGRLMTSGRTARVGLVATNSIRGGSNRRLLESVLQDGPKKRIFDAWSDEPWVVDGTAVRVSLICFSRADDASASAARLDGAVMDEVFTDLTGRLGGAGIDLTAARPLAANAKAAFMGDTKGGAFDISGDKAREWLSLPANPNGRPNADVLKPWMNAMDLTRRPKGKWIVDFGWTMSEEQAALYEAPFGHVSENVRSRRQKNKRESYRVNWWRHMEPRQGMWRAFHGLDRYVATPRVAKHRVFVWLSSTICPDSTVVAIARDDDTTFGILHSRFHEAWSLRLATSLGKGNDPRYTSTTTFATFPFPPGLTPDIAAADYADNPDAKAIADAARNLVALRDRWLNPPELVEWLPEPAPGYPKRPVAKTDTAAQALKARTLTNLYNARPQWLADAHAALDETVAAAYGWPADIPEEEALAALFALNQDTPG